MNNVGKSLVILSTVVLASSCVSKKKFTEMEDGYKRELDFANEQLGKYGGDIKRMSNQLNACEQDKARLQGEIKALGSSLALREEQVSDLKNQRDQTVSQVGELTVLSKSANDNIKETLDQLQRKDKYIRYVQAARTKADSINLALAVNLKSVLKEGIEDADVEIKVDKTVVFINLSDKMLYQSGSSNLTSRAKEVLGKIATIVQSRPNFEVMVEGYTDNVPIRNSCIKDNWDLSVKRATSVVRVLQEEYGVDPDRLIAAGRGEYNKLAPNDTPAGRAMNRRTRIIILPKLNEFYDLLNPGEVPE